MVHKESNRAEAIVNEFGKLGIDIRIVDDELIIHGKSKIHGGIFDSRNDHRMAMAGAILGLSAHSAIEIADYECVSKSYPTFFEHLQKVAYWNK